MNTRKQPQADDSFSTLALIEGAPVAQKRLSRLDWWYRITAPSVPATTASLKEREAYRRGKYISNTLLAMTSALVVITIVIGGIVEHAVLPNLGLTLLIMLVAAFFNGRGLVMVSGILVVLVLDVSIMAALLAYGTMTAYLLPFLDLLVIPELFAASLLPPVFVFFDMLLHLLYFMAVLTFLDPKDAQLLALLHDPGHFVDILTKPVVIQVIAAIISYTWMKSVTANVERADRATSIALLEKEVAEQTQLEAEQKRQLENEIREIIEVHRQVANGHFGARVPLREGNKLWSVAGSLNNLISRLQNLLRESQRLQQIDEAIARFFHLRSKARNGHIPWQPTGTSIDALVEQHNTIARSPERREREHE